ncbi:beta-lactamase family protein [Purpureocillium lilacinum]|uniref:Beta-lactamase family protein n=1 Tax=Purpureocillium lilacinum TaxID=33203 RepID=A0A179GKQ5_PURLI|nr:beta-lactamase family protein [Purpureocillium lilacinum]OAQ78088.1 beta-lactamase family protein [Purpureocillium lilacinum]
MPSFTRLLLLSAVTWCAATAFSPCPLIGQYLPPPTITQDDATSLSQGYRASFDSLVQHGGSDKYGEISANTTSFAVVFFAGATGKTIFEYYHTADNTSSSVDSNTRFPVGDVTMVFTVYSWLAMMGEHWDAPITKFLPELADAGPVPWEDVTIGSLAGHMSGLPRHVCTAPHGCSDGRLRGIADQQPVFLPDTTPMVSYAAFEVLAAAMERSKSRDFASLLQSSILGPLNMSRSGLRLADVFAARNNDLPAVKEPAALSMVSTVGDLARAGKAILSSKLIPAAVTRRWLHSNADTSNLRNGVGRPWEVYRAGSNATSPILDVFTKSGAVGPYASYFGLAPDFDAGFAILAHDATVKDGGLDLNVYADVASEALESLLGLAARQSAMRFGGTYGGDKDRLVLSQGSPGLEVKDFKLDGVDMMAVAARQLGIMPKDLDYRLYPTNVKDARHHQFVAVFQDRAAPVDMGTPTCITWQSVDAQAQARTRFVFELNDQRATGVVLGRTRLARRQ